METNETPCLQGASVSDEMGTVLLPTEPFAFSTQAETLLIPKAPRLLSRGLPPAGGSSHGDTWEEQWGRKGLSLGGRTSSSKRSPLLPSSLLRDHGPDAAEEDQIHGAGAGCEHHPGAAVVVGHAAGHRPAAGGPPVSPGTLPSCPDCPEL